MTSTSRNATSPDSAPKSRIGGCLYIYRYNAKPFIYDSTSYFLHLTSNIIRLPSIQLFHRQSYGHTFPVPNEPTKSEVHQIPNHPAMICSIELPHYLFFATVLDGSSIEFLFCPVCCHAMAAFSCPVWCDIIVTTHTDSSSYIVPSFPEVF